LLRLIVKRDPQSRDGTVGGQLGANCQSRGWFIRADIKRDSSVSLRVRKCLSTGIAARGAGVHRRQRGRKESPATSSPISATFESVGDDRICRQWEMPKCGPIRNSLIIPEKNFPDRRFIPCKGNKKFLCRMRKELARKTLDLANKPFLRNSGVCDKKE